MTERAFRCDRIGHLVVLDRQGLMPAGAPRGAIGARIDEETGFLHVPPSKIARSGPLTYSDGETEWVEFRSDATIAAAAESFSGAVFTHNHPPELVNTDNVRRFQAGHAGRATAEGRDLLVDGFLITDRAAIKRAQEPGGWELSIGFLTSVVKRDGVAPDGTPFAFEQTDIEGNHIAGVDVGRAGPEFRLAMDSAYSVAALAEPDAPAHQPKPAEAEDNTMPENTEGAEPKADTAPEAPAETPTAPIQVEAKADTAEAQAPAPVDPTAAINRRVSLLRAADIVLDSVDDNASDEVIQLAVIAKVDGDEAIATADTWSADYRAATFDAAVRSHKRQAAQPRIDTAKQIAAAMARGTADANEPTGLEGVFVKYDNSLRDSHHKPAAHQEPKQGL